jgi:hypothetical protein
MFAPGAKEIYCRTRRTINAAPDPSRRRSLRKRLAGSGQIESSAMNFSGTTSLMLTDAKVPVHYSY